MDYRDLIRRLRQEAAFLRKHGSTEAACTKDEDANIVEEFLTQYHLEALDLTAAAAESGYTAQYIGDLLRSGEIENVGEKGRPLIRRQDLPKKGNRRTQ